MSFVTLMLLASLAGSAFPFPAASGTAIQTPGIDAGLDVGLDVESRRGRRSSDYGYAYFDGQANNFLDFSNPLAYGAEGYIYDDYAEEYFKRRYPTRKPEANLVEGLVGGLLGGLVIGKSSGDRYVGLVVDGHRIGIGYGLDVLRNIRF